MIPTRRRRFIWWVERIIGHQEGKVLPKWLLAIVYVLHPTLAIANLNPWLRVDPEKRTLVWRGVEISIEVLDAITETTSRPYAYTFKRERNQVIAERHIVLDGTQLLFGIEKPE